MLRYLNYHKLNIWSPILADGFVIGNTIDEKIISYSLKEEKMNYEIGGKKISSTVKYNDLIIADSHDRQLYIFNIRNGILYSYKPNLRIANGKINNDKLLLNEYLDNEVNLCVYNCKNDLNEWKKNFKIGHIRFFDNRNIFCSELTIKTPSPIELICLSIDDGSEKWSLDVSEIGRYNMHKKDTIGSVRKVVGVYKNIVVVSITGDKLLGIDINSGEIVWTCHSNSYLQFHPNNLNLIYGIGASNVWCIDARNGKMIYKQNLEKQYKKFNVDATSACFSIYGDFIYFANTHKGKIGALHIPDKKIIWSFHLPGDVGIPSNNHPILHQNRLYVTDSEGTLHIFEKE
jgi:outer membrane protein assembly factor BamB